MHGEARIVEGTFGRATVLWPGNDLVPHAHPEAHIVVPLSDSITQAFFVDSDLYQLEPGHAILVNPLEVHSFHAEFEDQSPPGFLLFYVRPEWLAEGFNLPAAKPFSRREIRLSGEVRAQVASLVDAIVNGYSLDDLLNTEIELFIANFVRVLDDQQNAQMSQPIILPRFDFRIRKAMQFMQQNLDSRYTLDCVARNSGLSRPHFFSLFVRQVGMTPRLYWNVLRIERALGDLQDSDVQLGMLAYDLGFTSPGNFSRFFRERIGVSPLLYRRAVQ